jgi:hypothetical protein
MTQEKTGKSSENAYLTRKSDIPPLTQKCDRECEYSGKTIYEEALKI